MHVFSIEPRRRSFSSLPPPGGPLWFCCDSCCCRGTDPRSGIAAAIRHCLNFVAISTSPAFSMLNDYDSLSGSEVWDGNEEDGSRPTDRPRESFDTVSKRLFDADESRFVNSFPERWEEALSSFDDAVIARVQSSEQPCCNSRRATVLLSMTITSATAIEFGLSIPVLLLSLQQYDREAIAALYVMLSMAFLTQIFKRFVWRDRPFAVGRAIALHSELKTSSFPSRAVVGGVVYASFVGALLSPYRDALPWGPSTWLSWLLVAGLAIGSSWSRIVLGVHYPSDCLCGAALGLVIFVIGVSGARLHYSSCGCHFDDADGGSGDDDVGGSSDSENTWAAVVLVLGLFLSSGSVTAMAAPPINFWKKGTHAFSLLFSSLIFTLAFRCPRLTRSKRGSLPWGLQDSYADQYSPPSMLRRVAAVSFCVAVSALAMSTQKHKAFKKTVTRQLLSFVAVAVAAIAGLVLLRLN